MAATLSIVSYAENAVDSAAAPAASAPWSGEEFNHRAAFMHLMHKLNLSTDQKTQIKSILKQGKSQREAALAAAQANREALAAIAPTDPKFAALIEQAKSNAVARIQERSETWAKIYAILTPEQQAQIPGIVAAEKSAQ
ncbi:MAG TPA: Spy/CpxP family protein refolding chaperone [Steroidobacteraceae bacterium]